MQRAWSWAGAAAAVWLLAALPTPVYALGTAGVILESSYNVTALPESCSYVRKDFGPSPIFDYQAGWTSNATIPGYCSLEISYLFLDGSCSALRNTTGNMKPCGVNVGANNASCEAALRHGRPAWWDGSGSWWSVVHPNAPATTTFDVGAICDDAPSIGYFYVHNSCNLTFDFTVKITVEPRSSCHLAAGAAAMFQKCLTLAVYIIFTVLKYVFYAVIYGLLTAIVILLGAGLCICLAQALVWAFRSCFCQRPVLPPSVRMAPVAAGKAAAAAKDCAPLLAGGHQPTPAPPGCEQPARKRPGTNLEV